MDSNFLVTNATVIQLKQLLIGYNRKSIGKPVTGRFKRGSMTAIIGVNGSGKSTLLQTIAGLLFPVSGKIEFCQEGRPRIGYLPQQTEIDRQFPLKVFEVVSMGCWPATSILSSINNEQKIFIWNSLKQVGLDNKAFDNIGSLSNGEFQRMLFARLLVQQAPLVLLDEPFTSIDSSTSSILLTIITQLHQQGSTLIVVLHDYMLVAKYFPTTLLLSPIHNAWGSSADILKQFIIPTMAVRQQQRIL